MNTRFSLTFEFLGFMHLTLELPRHTRTHAQRLTVLVLEVFFPFFFSLRAKPMLVSYHLSLIWINLESNNFGEKKKPVFYFPMLYVSIFIQLVKRVLFEYLPLIRVDDWCLYPLCYTLITMNFIFNHDKVQVYIVVRFDSMFKFQ